MNVRRPMGTRNLQGADGGIKIPPGGRCLIIISKDEHNNAAQVRSALTKPPL
jgi:hypothetical protein